MAWSSPATYTTGQVVTAADLNLVRDNLLQTAPAKVTTAGDILVATGANALKRLALGAALTVPRVNSAGTDLEYSPLELPWIVDVNVFVTPYTQTDWSAINQSGSPIYGGQKTSTGAQNAEIGWDITLAAGTWTCEIMFTRATNGGIITVSLDASTVGTIDTYNASGADNQLGNITGIAVAATGKTRLLLKMATKHASSSGYLGRINHVQFRRTA